MASTATAARSGRGATATNTGDATALMNGGVTAQTLLTPREGRGQVEIVQQPTAENRYTTRIRITDPAPGYGHYDFNLSLR